MLQNNTFTRCSVGQKGSALYTRQISNVIIKNNTFEENRPSMALYPTSKQMPYQKILLGKTYKRPYFYHNPDLSTNIDEWRYMRLYATSYDAGGLIDLP